MRRAIEKDLKQWKGQNPDSRLPIILRGARQVGKELCHREIWT